MSCSFGIYPYRMLLFLLLGLRREGCNNTLATFYHIHRHLFPHCECVSVSLFLSSRVCAKFYVIFFAVFRTRHNLFPQLFWITFLCLFILKWKVSETLLKTRFFSFAPLLFVWPHGHNMEMKCNNLKKKDVS